jgi:hypothetical protein
MSTTEEHINDAYQHALENYFEQCRSRVPQFVKNHFRYPGAFRTNHRALGWDLLRSPLNLFWAPLYLCLMLFAYLIGKLGLTAVSQALSTIPGGFTTNVQSYVAERVQTELLQLESIEGTTVTSMAKELAGENGDTDSSQEQLPALIEQALEEYAITRTATADITNALTSSLIGALAWNKFALGAFAIGFMVAAEISHYLAVQSFIFGESLGALYYSVFPAEPSTQVRFLGVMSALMLMAVFAALSGFISDPIQSWLGLHQRRLLRMINSLEQDVLQTSNSRYKPKDQYLARLADSIDALRTPLG